MKLRKQDKVIVVQGRDKGKTGTVLAVLPTTNQVLVENINVVKRHTKPSQKTPRGGILDVTKPINASKVMVLDPSSGKPARISYEIKADGSKERVFKVSPNHDRPKAKSKTRDSEADKSKSNKTDAKDESKDAKSKTSSGEAGK